METTETPTTAQAPAENTEAAALLGENDMTYGPGPDAFPPGVHFCFLHGAPDAAGAMFTVRLKAQQGYLFAPHSHPHDEHVTIVSGTLLLGNGSKADRAAARKMGPGSYAFLPREQFHYAWAVDEVVFQVNAIGPFGITYANPEDDPRRSVH
jgi:quercetin dioxygenase-like cupin family protein